MSESIIGYPTILLSDGAREWVGGDAEDEDNAAAESWRNYAIDVWHELQEIALKKTN